MHLQFLKIQVLRQCKIVAKSEFFSTFSRRFFNSEDKLSFPHPWLQGHRKDFPSGEIARKRFLLFLTVYSKVLPVEVVHVLLG